MNTLSQRTYGKRGKVEETCSLIHNLALGLGPGAKLPTVLELRDSLSVSITTLSLALNELEAQNVVRRQNGVGLFVSESLGVRNYALICDTELFHLAGTSPFWELLLQQLRERASNQHETLNLHFTALGRTEGMALDSNLVQDIRNRRMDGIVMIGLNPETMKWVVEQGVPAVGYATPSPFRVRHDEPAEVAIGVEALAKAGCQKIAVWSAVKPKRKHDAERARSHIYLDAYIAALEAADLPYRAELLEDNLDLIASGEGIAQMTLREQGYWTARKVFGRDASTWPDGIIISDDVMALGALIGLAKFGIRPGHEVQIASHANLGSAVLHGYEDDLFLLQSDPALIVQTLFSLLEQLLAGAVPAEPLVQLRPQLVSPVSARENF